MPVDRFQAALLAWYDGKARTLPWRLPPGVTNRPDPYAIWLSEIMAQQTRLVVAERYWRRFMALWPRVDMLAAADEAEVLREWAGLGYYARARNLVATAREVSARGGFPKTEAELRQLPGIGPYTAAAIAAIAFGEPVVGVDANVARVAARLFGIAETGPAALNRARAALLALLPKGRPGDFTQALMDLGATICAPHLPDCASCPVTADCKAYRTGATTDYPVKRKVQPRPKKQGVAWWIEHAGEVALVRRPRHGLLGGMQALPGTPWSAGESDQLPFPADWQLQPFTIRHVFTHFELSLRVAKASVERRPPVIDGQPLLWVPREALPVAGLPSIYLRIVEQMLERVS